MNETNKYLTLREIFLELTSEDYSETLWCFLGNFLDNFYRSSTSQAERYRMVRDQPLFADYVSERDRAFIAGMAHKLCEDYRVRKPFWIFHDEFFLKEPYFSNDAQNELRLVLLRESPAQFRIRNIFTSANTLVRV